MKLAGRVAVITGGARGIGPATAASLAGPGRVYRTVCDVTRATEVYVAARRTREALGEVDILVSNAGTVPFSAVPTRTGNSWSPSA